VRDHNDSTIPSTQREHQVIKTLQIQVVNWLPNKSATRSRSPVHVPEIKTRLVPSSSSKMCGRCGNDNNENATRDFWPPSQDPDGLQQIVFISFLLSRLVSERNLVAVGLSGEC
jgi:hypothetical protein